MPKSLKINVQVDRLPDVVEAEKRHVQLGLRVSALIKPPAQGDPVDPATDADTPLLLPWLWRTEVAKEKSWNPHAVTSWTIWRAPKNDPAKLHPINTWTGADALVGGLKNLLAVFDDGNRLLGRITADIENIIEERGAPAGLEQPVGKVVAGRTVFGLVETLTSLPHPVPMGLKVWTAVSIPADSLSPPLDDLDRFVAIPVFATSAAAYTPNQPTTASPTEPWLAQYTASANAIAVGAEIHPNRGMDDLSIPNTQPERLIDASRLIVRARKGRGFEASDWTATLADRIAEIIDPAARALSVLDTAIAGAMSTTVELPRALKDDLETSNDALRVSLRNLHVPVLVPRTAASRAGLPPAVALLEAAANRTSELWPHVAPLLMTHAATDGAGSPPFPRFHVVTRERIASAADLTFTSPEAQASSVPVIDTDAGLAKWIVEHWTKKSAPAKKIPANGKWLFDREHTQIAAKRNGDVNQAVKIVSSTGVLDFSRVPRVDRGPEVALKWHLSGGKQAAITLSLESPQQASPLRTVVLKSAFAETTLQVGTGLPTPIKEVVTSGVFGVTFTFGSAGAVKAVWSYVDDSGFTLKVEESAVDLANAGRLRIILSSSVAIDASFRSADETGDMRAESLTGEQAQAIRRALSAAYAGPFVTGLLAGFLPVESISTPVKESEPPIDVRLPDMVRRFVTRSFTDAFEKASSGLDGPLVELFRRIRDEAIAEAHRLSHNLIPPSSEVVDRVTEDAQPLAFLIDQMQDFSDIFDLWEHLAGLGVLLGRDGNANQWWSLNAATLHVTNVGARGRMDENNAVRTSLDGEWPKGWLKAAKVNPVPLVVGESSGVRSALVRYENQSLVGQVQTAPELSAESAGPAQPPPRRPEAYLFPTTDFAKLPPLTFGRTYHVIPYLISHGGALPLLARQTSIDPVTPRSSKGLGEIEILPEELKDLTTADYTVVRSRNYPRTVPVSAPRLASSGTEWPDLFPGIVPLADELPLLVPFVTLPVTNDPKDLSPTRFFLDKEQLRGTLTGSGETSGLQIEIPRIQLPATVSTEQLRIDVVHFPSSGGASRVVLTAAFPLTELAAKLKVPTNGCGLLVDVIKDVATVSVLELRDGVHADDLPAVHEFRTIKVTEPIGDWRSAYLRISAVSSAFGIEPPVARWGTIQSSGGKDVLLPDGGRAIAAPEAAHGSRKVAVLDGITIGNRTGPQSARLALRRPAVSLATYDRWINFPLSQPDTAARKAVALAIDTARRHVTTGTSDRTLEDPAVEALFIEVVQRFPRRQVCTVNGQTAPGLTLVKKLNAASLPDILGMRGSDLATSKIVSLDMASVKINADTKATPATGLPNISIKESGDERNVVIDLVPGCVYDLTFYGGVPASQSVLFNKPTADRFSPAARAGWREFVDPQKNAWHLGAPLTLTVEVATDLMPEIALINPGMEAPAFAIDLARPPMFGQDRALVRLAPENVGDPIVAGKPAPALRYPAMRCVNRMALLDQRWSWRGLPQPLWPLGEDVAFGTKAVPVKEEVGRFVDRAFIGRAHDDVGTVREVTITRSHGSGGLATMVALDVPGGGFKVDTKATRPTLLEKDLNYRGGSNLWRLALRAKSRYAAMRPNHPAMIRFSHRQEGTKPAAWWPLVVQDRTASERNPRRLDRPSLMLVLPLTEPVALDDAVPPVLAVFNQQLYPLFNIGDGIETCVEVARFPLKVNDRPRYWPEFGPDPIRTGDPAAGQPIATRTDGPIGYTFDLETEAGRFDHAAVVVSPASPTVESWSFLKLRFRRSEIPEFLAEMPREGKKDDPWPDAAVAKKSVNLTAPIVVRLSSDAADDTVPFEGPVRFRAVHEGIAVDIESLDDSAVSGLKVSFCQQEEAGCGEEHTTVEASITEADSHRVLTVRAKTHLGRAADWFAHLEPGSTAGLRVVISQRPKPNGVDPYQPMGDVSVRVRITRRAHDLRTPEDPAWLSVLCMPLTAETSAPILPAVPVNVRIAALTKNDQAPRATLRPVRLSDFSPSVWCQFATAMSRVHVMALTSLGRKLDEMVHVSRITARMKDEGTLTLGLSGLAPGETVKGLWLLSETDAMPEQPDARRQVEEPLFAVVTRYIHDAFDLVRERPIRIHRVIAPATLGDEIPDPDTVDLGPVVWPIAPTVPEAYRSDTGGRVRFVRVLRGRLRENGGFEPVEQQFPAAFIAQHFGDMSVDDPRDAPGLVLGISKPIDWTGPIA